MLKNTFKNSHHQRGHDCETLVIDKFARRGYTLSAQRVRTPYAEVDLLLEDSSRYLMIEVKSSAHSEFEAYRLGWKQRLRLQRAFLYLQEQLSKPLEFLLVIVVDDEMHIFDEILG